MLPRDRFVSVTTEPALRTLVYLSSATRPLSEAELEILLDNIRRNNRALGVTGVLLHNDGNIVQCLEGPAEGVRQVFDRIQASRRHHGIMILLDEPITVRSFDDWDMGFAQPAASELLNLSTARWKEHLASLDGVRSRGLRQLRSFWDGAQR